MLKLSTTAFKRVYFGLLERFYGVDANPRISLYARIGFAREITLLPSNYPLLIVPIRD